MHVAPASKIWARNTATGCCACSAKAPNSPSSHSHRPSVAQSTAPSVTAFAARSCSTATATAWTATPPPADYAASPPQPEYENHVHHHMLRTYVTTMLDAGVSLRDVQIDARHADPKTSGADAVIGPQWLVVLVRIVRGLDPPAGIVDMGDRHRCR